MSIKYCATHEVGWFMHERDETCRSDKFPDTKAAEKAAKYAALKKRRAKNKMRNESRNKNR